MKGSLAKIFGAFAPASASHHRPASSAATTAMLPSRERGHARDRLLVALSQSATGTEKPK